MKINLLILAALLAVSCTNDENTPTGNIWVNAYSSDGITWTKSLKKPGSQTRSLWPLGC